ncbi:Yae1 family protein [Aspergillus brunneoviolaceus CBS 621.78]|uniref:Uncharacterized protein n=1 Tax=Aspergillus brunneoviolaceus CBS 621.78 TaxID=1450534 RepID=A0ACD1FZH2_9EURO|nr:hypothetical protein BO95DRAFT_455921 [Aspergillus brunneoviolaceus CBS 621.78]RAH42364.1 hypothetical protein BO95DRAFT_455921 [Aspergillus brunneoviolaceus CBS 621.78]
MENTLDDIFGSSPPHDDPDHNHTPAPATEPSDLPSLRRQHVTAGYRDGLAAAKSTQVQSGFDAGFPVGAQLGMRVGTILGILEGAIRGLEEPARKGVRKAGEGGGATPTATASATTTATATATAEETPRERKRAELLGLYRRAVRELDIRKVFGGVVSAEDLPGQAGTGKQTELPETKLARKAEEVISAWERRVQVALWEENMDALELKELKELSG